MLNDQTINAGKKFVTNVGLTTSNGPIGQNIMSAEWTHRISSDPFLIAICLNAGNATNENILNSNEFGVNLASESQGFICSISGNYTGKEIDKIKALEKLGAEFYKAENIDAPMLKNAAATFECKVIEHKKYGSHMMYIGCVVKATYSDENPIVYHSKKFWKISENIPKPNPKKLEEMEDIIEKHRK